MKQCLAFRQGVRIIPGLDEASDNILKPLQGYWQATALGTKASLTAEGVATGRVLAVQWMAP